MLSFARFRTCFGGKGRLEGTDRRWPIWIRKIGIIRSRMARHFPNRMADFVPGNRVDIDVAHWKETAVLMARRVNKKMPPTFESCDGGLYVGCAGVAYMFYYMSTAEVFADMKGELLTRAKNYMDVSLSYAESRCRDPTEQASFLLGRGGVYACGALIYEALGEKNKVGELIAKYLSLSSVCQNVNFLPCGSDELFVGRSGYLCGAKLLNRHFGEVINKDAIAKVCQSILHSGRIYSSAHRSPCPLMYAYYGTEYLGAAHGLTSILQMLLCQPDFLKGAPNAEAEVRQCVDYLLSLMHPNGNFAPDLSEALSGERRGDKHELVHWCHGGPGVVYMLAQAFLLWRDDRYLDACLRCGELTWQKGLLRKGPGICHGVAGSGYVFLLLYRLTSDEKHLHRALKFAEFILTEEFEQGARVPDSPHSLYEGLAGTICFLTDLLQPLKAEFPFFDVFSK